MEMITLKVCDIYEWLDGVSPFASAEDYDNVGLLVGDWNKTVRKVLFCVDMTAEAAQKAAAEGAELIVSHHPIMFGGIHKIHYHLPEGETLRILIGEGISVIAAHTNFDKAAGGTGDSLAAALGLLEVQAVDDFLRVGKTQVPLTMSEFETMTERVLGTMVRRYGETKREISCVAVGAGAYGEGAQGAIFAGAQAFVVGEIKHHEIVNACTQGLVVLEAGHYATEAPGMVALQKRFHAEVLRRHWDVQSLLLSNASFMGVLSRS